jgi:segregation and condensation protein A
MSFNIHLDIFRGPLDLLLYLVRQHELEIADIPVARIADQYLEYLNVLQEIDINAVGDFLEVAATLVEMKSRLVLPHGDEVVEELNETGSELVQRLLEYKRFRDAASMLDERGREWQQRYPRLADDTPPRRVDPSTQPIHEVELWDLVSAFGRVIRDNRAVQPSNIVYDETPIHVYMERIHRQLADKGRMAFSEMFSPGMHKSAMIGVFLAVLELVRHHSVVTEQSDLHGEIWMMAGDNFRAAEVWTQVTSATPAIDSPPADDPAAS